MTCSIIKTDCITQGSSYPLAYGVKGVTDLSDWTCYIQVSDKKTKVVTGIDREITDKNTDGDRFITILTKTETDNLPIGEYIVGAELENTVTGECGEILMQLNVEDQWVVRP